MGYSLRAVVAKHQLFKATTVDYGEVRLISLAFGFAMIPVTDNLFDELANRNPSPLTNLFPEIFWLSAAVASWCLQLSRDGAVAFLAADYFGGTGRQSAIVWDSGKLILGPVYSSGLRRDGAIDQALRSLGVVAAEPLDEFETVGLRKHRETSDWLEEAGA